ncbi:MAG: GNAT family N-acetyltransferase [Actinomycetota bacterium]
MSGTAGRRALGDGLVLRDATGADAGEILARCREAFGAAEEPAVRRAFEIHGVEAFAVVADERARAEAGGERLAACASLQSRTLRLDGVAVPAGQVEFVATAEGYRRRGLARALLERLHDRSARQGHLVGLVFGIPYLYRRLGYSRAPGGQPRLQLRRGASLAAPPGTTTRPAEPGDVAALAALHREAQAAAQVSTDRDDRLWPSLLAWPGEEDVAVAERDGRVAAYARTWRLGARRWTFEAAAADRLAATALLAGLAAEDPLSLAITDAPGTPLGSVLVDAGLHLDAGEPPYARVPDPLALLRHLAGPLEARLAASPFAVGEATLRLNLYTHALAIHARDGTITAIEPDTPVEDLAVGATTLPPERLPELLLGARDIAALEAVDPDVRCDGTRALTRTLLPARLAAVAPE